MFYQRDEFEVWEDLIERLPPALCLQSEDDDDSSLEFPSHIDLAAGECFRASWRRRLAAAEGDFGHVARQMRKAGVPLNLALVVLLTPEPPAAPQPVSCDAAEPRATAPNAGEASAARLAPARPHDQVAQVVGGARVADVARVARVARVADVADVARVAEVVGVALADSTCSGSSKAHDGFLAAGWRRSAADADAAANAMRV